MWSFDIRLYLEEISGQLVVMENMHAENSWNNFELRSGYFAQSGLWWINRKVWYFFLVLLYKSDWGFRCRKSCKKTRPWWWGNSTMRNELNQPETHSLDVSHCWNFNAEIEKFKFPIPSYAISVKFPFGICFALKQYAYFSYRGKGP